MADLAAQDLRVVVDPQPARLDDVHVIRIHADPAHDLLQPGRRDDRLLRAGHPDRAVVHDQDGHVRVGGDRVEQRRHARMEERAVADHGHDRVHAGLGGSLRHADRRAHADARFDHRVGRQRAERVAADVGRHHDAGDLGDHLPQRKVRVRVRAALAQLRRPARQREALERALFPAWQPEARAHDVGIEFAVRRQVPGEPALDRDRRVEHAPQLALDDRVTVLDHEDARDVRRQAPDQPDRHRVGADVQVRRRRAEFGSVLVIVGAREPARDHAQVTALVAQGERVEAAGFAPRQHLALALEQVVPLAAGVRRQEDPRRALGRAGDRVLVARGADVDQRAAVREPCHQPHQHGHAEALRELEGLDGHVVGLLLAAGLEAEDASKVGVPTAVLLVLRAVHARVVGHGHDQAAVDFDQGRVDERIRRHVEPDVLHRHQRPSAGKHRAERLFVGGLLVGAPGGVRRAVLRAMVEQVLEDLGRRRARIAVRGRDARVHGAQGHGFVAEKDGLSHETSGVGRFQTCIARASGRAAHAHS